MFMTSLPRLFDYSSCQTFGADRPFVVVVTGPPSRWFYTPVPARRKVLRHSARQATEPTAQARATRSRSAAAAEL